jgi:hypothetical protein
MKYLSKYPFESLVFLSLVYYQAIIFFLEPIPFSQKISYLLINIVFFIVILLFGVAFRNYLNNFGQIIFSVFISGKFAKLNIFSKFVRIFLLSFLPLIISSLVEYLLTFLFTTSGTITVGFPLPVYSFSASKLLISNFLVNITLFSSIIYFLGYSITHNSNNQ